MEDVLKEFIEESSEIVEQLSNDISKIEKNKNNKELLNSIYRNMHTIKGSAQLFGFTQIGKLGHSLETCLDPVRDLRFELDSSVIDLIFKSLDIFTQIIKDTAAANDYKGPDPDVEEELKTLVPKIIDITSEKLKGHLPSVTNPIFFSHLDFFPQKNILADEKKDRALDKPMNVAKVRESKPHKTEFTQLQKNESSSLQKETPPPKKIPEPQTEREKPLASPSAKRDSVQPTKEVSMESSIRVHVGLLDNLMNLIGELVLIRNQVLQFSNKIEDNGFVKLSQRLNIVTSELQNDVMKTRMQPIGNILNKFNRVVRDLGKELNKSVELKLFGTDTELDKTLIEAVKDPLTHIVRNSIDHGLEKAEERQAVGKSPTGQVVIRAFHEGGQVIIEIKDDGKGLDRDAIAMKAVEKNIVNADSIHNLSDKDVFQLIFAPGFSTAEHVSKVSGRGVGMDVVKTNIEKIGGMVDLTSIKGKETSIKLKIPLTLAIIPALIVTCEDYRFAIPQVKVVELVRLDEQEDGLDQAIEMLQGKPVMRLRGKLLPLVDFSSALKLRNDLQINEVSSVVVLNADGNMLGVIVDAIEDSADIVVKPLSQLLKKISMYSGATIMGDGSVVLILDVMGIASYLSDDAKEQQSPSGKIAELQDTETKVNDDLEEFLLVKLNEKNKYAIPLCLVNRLEEFSRQELEYTGDQQIIRYRDTILPLINVAKFLEIDTETSLTEDLQNQQKISVIVVAKGDRLFGLSVKSILDVIKIENKIDRSLSDRSGIMGNIINNDETLIVIDVFLMIDEVKNKIFTNLAEFTRDPQKIHHKNKIKEKRALNKVLVVDDASFFRSQVTDLLREWGFQTQSAINGEKAVEKLTENNKSQFHLIMSDIEMPDMDGFQLADILKSNDAWSKIPLLGMSTKYNDKIREKVINSGFDEFIEKLNADELLKILDQMLGIGDENA